MVLVFSTILHSEAVNPYLDYLIRGDESYYNGNFVHAYELYDSARTLRPSEVAPLTGLYHTSIKLMQRKNAALFAEQLYEKDSSAINLERRVFGNSFNGNWSKTVQLAKSGLIDQIYGYDLAGQGFYQGGYLLEAWRITDKAYKFNPEYPLLFDRKQAIEDALSTQQPLLTFSNSTAYFKYQNHQVLKNGIYNGFDLNGAYLAHSLNFSWSEQQFTARPIRQLTDSLAGSIHEQIDSISYVPITDSHTRITTFSNDSGYVITNHAMTKIDKPVQREFYLGYQYSIFTDWSVGMSYKYGLADNDVWSKGQTLRASTDFQAGNWTIHGSVSYGKYQLNDFKLSTNRVDSTYQYQQTWDTAYQNIDGNYEKDTIFYSYRNDYSIYTPEFSISKLTKSVWQLNLGGGYTFNGLYLGGSGAVNNISGSSKWDWNYKSEIAYTYAAITLWGAYSRGYYNLFNSADGKVFSAIMPMLKQSYEGNISWRINRSWQFDLYYGDKNYTDYSQKLYLAGLTYRLYN